MSDEDVLFDRTADSVEINTNSDNSLKRISWHKIYTTILLSLAFFVLGLYISIPGPTLVDLSEITNTNLSEISWLFTARSVGYLCGSLVGGMLFDCFNRLILIGITLIFAGVSICFIPLSKNLFHLLSLIIFQGLSMGVLDTGGNVLCLDTWHQKSGSALQLLHFSFGFGAFIAPLIAEPFLAQHHELNKSLLYNSSASSLNNSDNTVITFTYMFLGTFGIIIGLSFVLFFLYNLRFKPPLAQAHLQKRFEDKDENLNFRVKLLSLLAFFFFFYVGSEVAYASFISSVSIRLHNWSRAKAAFLVSIYWGSFTAGRFISIFLTRIMTITNILIMDLILSTSSLILLSIFADMNEKVLWIMSGTLGFGFASIFPGGISWAEMHINISGKVASIFVVGSALGEMVIPVIAGHIIFSPMALFYFLLVISCLCVFIFLLMLLLIYWHTSTSSRDRSEDQLPLTSNATDDESLQESEQSFNDKKRHVTFNLSNNHVPINNGLSKNSILKVKDISKKD